MTELPTSFGKYFLTEKLATGGMAEIYLAKIVGPGGFEKPLVIKQIHPKLTGQRHFVDLFVAEAKTLVTMAHGNIVPVYELGVIDDTYFIAMEYIDGPTLYRLTETLARRGVVMEPAIAAWITARILEGLDYAHRKGEGIIHRDLSPRNVMLSRDGEVKLVDFGIAVSLGTEDGSHEQGAPVGSFPYMSPEQVRREALSGQSDLFSVGVLCWEMLVGHRLFARPDPDATLAAVTDEEIERPSVASARQGEDRPAIPARLDEVVMRALERDQTARWANAGEMLAALQKYLYGLEETPGPREVAALVARYCPPETRRLPTHAESAGADGDPPPVAGPHTAVIPRDGAARGKKRARTETFATHVDLQRVLERATPLFPIPAITDDDAPAPSDPATTSARTRMPRETVETNPPAAPRSRPMAAVAPPADPGPVTRAVPPRVASGDLDAGPTTRVSGSRAAVVAEDSGPTTRVSGSRAVAAEDSGPTTRVSGSRAVAAEDSGPTTRVSGSRAAVAAEDSGPTTRVSGSRAAVVADEDVEPRQSSTRLRATRADDTADDRADGARGDATPARASAAARGDATPARASAATRGDATPARASATTPARGDANGAAAATNRPLPIPGRLPPSRGLLVAAAAGTFFLGILALFMFARSRGSAGLADAPRRDDAPFWLLDGPGLPRSIDAGIPDAPVLVVPDDAAVATGTDASPPDAAQRTPDAAERPDAPPIDAAPAGTGQITIGAEPWAEIYIDGIKKGTTPLTIEMPVGNHVIELVFSGEDPPRRQRFDRAIKLGDNAPVHYNFNKP